MEEWKEYKLGDVCSRLRSGKGIKADSVFNSGKYPVIGGNGVRGYADVPNFEGQAAIIGRQGAYCGNVRFFEGEAYMTEHAIVAVGNELADTRFLACLLSLMHLGNLSAQSAQPGISVQTLSKQPIRLPSISYQKKISAIIKSIDDKIEVNGRINDNFYYAIFEVLLIWLVTSLRNDNLEQQAQALFKSWFVDFEPFRDQPFVESELGMIPEGWKVVSLDEACTKITDGSHFSPKENLCGTIPMLSVKDMQHNGFDYSSCKMIDEVDYLKMEKNDCVPLFNDILVAKDGSYLKEIFICKEEKKQAILSSIAIFRSNPKVIYPDLLLQLLRLPKIKKDVGDNYVSGSALPRIVLKDFKKFKFVVPPVDIQEKTIGVYISINAQIEKNEIESRRLAQLCDTLLPRLMSGEIKVGDVTL